MAACISRKAVRMVVILLLATGGVLLYRHYHRSAGAAGVLTLYGNVDIRQVNLAFQGSERVAEMAVREGDAVKAGQKLARLDTKRLAALVAQAQAQLAAQQEAVAGLLAGSRPQEIQKARADLAAAQAVLAQALLTAGRLEGLAKVHAAPQQDADTARSQANVAQAQVHVAQETLNLILEGPRQEDIKAAQAMLALYEAQLTLAQCNLADATLVAPVDGVIQNRILEPGDMANPQTAVYTLALTDPVWVRAYINEQDLGKVHLGMAAQVKTDSFPDKQYAGKVGFISPTAEFTPKTVETQELRSSLVYQVRIFVENPNNELRLGMPATVSLAIASRTGSK